MVAEFGRRCFPRGPMKRPDLNGDQQRGQSDDKRHHRESD
jgi:hypothetical protein